MAANDARQAGVAALAREIEEFMAAGGWDQPPQLFALVPTAALLDEQPELAGQLDRANPLTPVAQEALPEGDLAEALGRIAWPDWSSAARWPRRSSCCRRARSRSCRTSRGGGRREPRRAAADHPQRTEARLVAAVLRDGEGACVMRLRGTGTDEARTRSWKAPTWPRTWSRR